MLSYVHMSCCLGQNHRVPSSCRPCVERLCSPFRSPRDGCESVLARTATPMPGPPRATRFVSQARLKNHRHEQPLTYRRHRLWHCRPGQCLAAAAPIVRPPRDPVNVVLSLSLIIAVEAPFKTWKLVIPVPLPEIKKPVPEPLGTSKSS